MCRNDWNDIITGKTIRIEPFTCQGQNGKLSLLRIREVSAPFTIGGCTIADRGYAWVQAAMADAYFWMTAMFDAEGHFLQIYTDMTDGNVVDTEDPYFKDMYLDYVISANGVLELDMDELKAAYESGRITAAQYQRTVAEGQRLREYLAVHRQDVIDWFCEAYERLSK